MKISRYHVTSFLGETVFPVFSYIMVFVLATGLLFPKHTFLFALGWGALASVVAVVLLYAAIACFAAVDYIAFKWENHPPPPPPPRPPLTHDGRTLVDGEDYHGEHDRELIERYGYDCLNFVPSTPPQYR